MSQPLHEFLVDHMKYAWTSFWTITKMQWHSLDGIQPLNNIPIYYRPGQIYIITLLFKWKAIAYENYEVGVM